MSDVPGIASERIRSFVERIEQVDGEIADLNDGKKDIYAEAKGEGLDPKILKKVVAIRRQDQNERAEQETLLDLYLRAIGMEV